MSRRLSSLLLATALVALAASGMASTRAAADLTEPPLHDVLGAIDFVPPRHTFDAILAPAPAQGLALIATNPAEDPGIRLRALRALAHYPWTEDDPSTTAHDALMLVIDQLGEAASGTELLLQRAAIEALGVIGGPDDVAVITQFLSRDDLINDRNRDLRAAAAHALRVIGSPSAVPALRARQRIETVPQVSLAITEALRAILGGS